jgi:septal ring factor EnvC (AmiA/AmiB activator)
MTSDEIRNALKPFLDFAPAIIKAAEIVEAAEIAEDKLTQFEAEKIETQKAIEGFKIQLDEYAGKAAQARAEHHKLVQSLQIEAAEQREKNKVLRAEAANSVEQIKESAAEKNAMIAAKNEEIKRAQEVLSAIKGEISRLKSQFAA